MGESTVPRRNSPEGRRRNYRKGGVSEELTLESYADFFWAMHVEVRVRAGLMVDNPYVDRLPPRARERFSSVRRCTWSWLTDATSLALAARLKTARGVDALRAIVLSQVVFTSPEALALCAWEDPCACAC